MNDKKEDINIEVDACIMNLGKYFYDNPPDKDKDKLRERRFHYKLFDLRYPTKSVASREF